jgi:hypothetical protein
MRSSNQWRIALLFMSNSRLEYIEEVFEICKNSNAFTLDLIFVISMHLYILQILLNF